jgi:hypothetical protein
LRAVVPKGRWRALSGGAAVVGAAFAVWLTAGPADDPVRTVPAGPRPSGTSSFGSGQPVEQRPAWRPSGRPTSASLSAAIPRTTSPDVYASEIAGLLYGMDQRAYGADDYWSLLLDARDPQGDALIPAMTIENFEAALQTRIPDASSWQRMRESQQWAAFEVSDVWEPQYIRDKYTTGEAPPSAVMRNVAGTQTLHFLDEAGVELTRERQATVSVLMACAPARPTCLLLAVSAGVVQ